MSVVVLAVVALAGGLATLLVRPVRPWVAALIGIATAGATTALGLLMPVEDALGVGGGIIAGSNLIRLLAIAWSMGILTLGLLELEGPARGLIAGPALVGLAAAVVALALHDPIAGFACLAAGGIAAVLVPTLIVDPGARPDASLVRTVRRGTWAVIGSSLVGIAVIAWAASPVGPLANGPPAGDPEARAATGLALLGMVTAVVIRTGLIPAHVWIARLVEGVTPLAVPAALLWGSAAFVFVALEWGQIAVGPATTGTLERFLIVGLAVASIILGGLAALLHDDLEHILGYSILQDTGIAILAFASLQAEVAAAARDWLLAAAMLKTAMAAWVAVMRSTFGAHRLVELRGWVRRSPGLATALGVILLGVVGAPGMALFNARLTLVDGAAAGITATLVVVAALLPAAYLGRILVTGAAPAAAAVLASPSPWPRWSGGRAPGWSGRPLRELWKAVPVELRANRVPLSAAAVVVLAVVGFWIAVSGVGA